MLEFLNFVVLLFKVLVFCLIIAFFFWVAPAVIMEILEERKEGKKHHHRRSRNADDSYMRTLVDSYRERTAEKRDQTLVAFKRAKPIWSV